ncbi:MAG: hypothetical protein ABI822_12620 [Bryobacteraceae bacterium]
MRILPTFLLLSLCQGFAQDLLQPTNFGSLYFKFERGGANPPPQTLALGSEDRRPINILQVGPTWLHVSANSDGGPNVLTFTVDPAGLQPGIYEGSPLFLLGDSGQGTANIRLTVVDRARFITIPTELQFSDTSSLTQTLYVTAANQPVGFGVAVKAEAKWLTVTPMLGRTPTNLNVSVNPAGLAGGTYTTEITLLSEGAPELTVPVRLTVAGGPPAFSQTGVLNQASLKSGPIAPGELIKITGISNISAPFTTPTFTNGMLPTVLADTRLLFDGTPVPLLSVADGEVRAVVPFELDGAAATQAQLEFKGQKGPSVTLQVAPAQPGIFAADLSGKGQAVARHYNPSNQQFSQNGPPTPVEKGGILEFFVNGAGQFMPPGKTGSLNGGSGLLRLPAQATIGGKNAEIIYAGAAPGLEQGIAQFNIRIPMDSPSGDAVALAVTVNGVTSPGGVTAAVK